MNDVDYLIVGAGAMGMAFADVLFNESDATFAMVDDRPAPGGTGMMPILSCDCINLVRFTASIQSS